MLVKIFRIFLNYRLIILCLYILVFFNLRTRLKRRFKILIYNRYTCKQLFFIYSRMNFLQLIFNIIRTDSIEQISTRIYLFSLYIYISLYQMYIHSHLLVFFILIES